MTIYRVGKLLCAGPVLCAGLCSVLLSLGTCEDMCTRVPVSGLQRVSSRAWFPFLCARKRDAEHLRSCAMVPASLSCNTSAAVPYRLQLVPR